MTTAAWHTWNSRHSSLDWADGYRTAGVVFVLSIVLWGLWATTGQEVAVTVDGEQATVRTHRHTVGDLLLDLGVGLDEVDQIIPSRESNLRTVSSVFVQRARPVQLLLDGRSVEIRSWAETPRQLLLEADIAVDEYDRLYVNGELSELDDGFPPPLPAQQMRRLAPAASWTHREVRPLRMRIVRAVPIIVDDGGLPFTIRTTAETVGEALRLAEITIYLGDRVDPSMGSAVANGLRVTIQRSTPISLKIADRQIRTRTRAETVADALSASGVSLSPLDFVQPSLDAELYDDIAIKVTRVAEEIEIEEEIAPFETRFIPDPGLPIDTQQLVNPGAEGITRTRFRLRFENGQEVERTLEDRWIAQEPAERLIAYGQKIEPKAFTGPDGASYTYWRKIRMFASSYSAGTAGVSPDKAYYGKTYTGETMRFGIVAVDPAIIPLRSQVYVQDYGIGDALDIGSAIRARRIDLGYDDSNLILWNRWVEVYLLWPPPPDHQITWVLPNWPLPPQ